MISQDRCKNCNKNVYRTQQRAERFAERRSNDMYTLKTYPCPHGKGFHVSKYSEPFTWSKR